jgi:hypothetical protein
MLSQAYDDFDKIVIIEEGGSYYNLTLIYGDEAQYIVIGPSANLTLNYFDTGGLPFDDDFKRGWSSKQESSKTFLFAEKTKKILGRRKFCLFLLTL